MGCGCSKAKGSNYLFTDPTGQQQVFTSEVQAKVAKIKAGGGSITTIPK